MTYFVLTLFFYSIFLVVGVAMHQMIRPIHHKIYITWKTDNA